MRRKNIPNKSPNRRPMFEPGHALPTPLWCVLCGRRFRRWNGTANHGFMHQAALKQVKGAVTVELEAARYVFYVAA